jgi:hypothetical protein
MGNVTQSKLQFFAKETSRDDVCELYREYIKKKCDDDPKLKDLLCSYQGKTLDTEMN